MKRPSFFALLTRDTARWFASPGSTQVQNMRLQIPAIAGSFLPAEHSPTNRLTANTWINGSDVLHWAIGVAPKEWKTSSSSRPHCCSASLLDSRSLTAPYTHALYPLTLAGIPDESPIYPLGLVSELSLGALTTNIAVAENMQSWLESLQDAQEVYAIGYPNDGVKTWTQIVAEPTCVLGILGVTLSDTATPATSIVQGEDEGNYVITDMESTDPAYQAAMNTRNVTSIRTMLMWARTVGAQYYACGAWTLSLSPFFELSESTDLVALTQPVTRYNWEDTSVAPTAVTSTNQFMAGLQASFTYFKSQSIAVTVLPQATVMFEPFRDIMDKYAFQVMVQLKYDEEGDGYHYIRNPQFPSWVRSVAALRNAPVVNPDTLFDPEASFRWWYTWKGSTAQAASIEAVQLALRGIQEVLDAVKADLAVDETSLETIKTDLAADLNALAALRDLMTSKFGYTDNRLAGIASTVDSLSTATSVADLATALGARASALDSALAQLATHESDHNATVINRLTDVNNLLVAINQIIDALNRDYQTISQTAADTNTVTTRSEQMLADLKTLTQHVSSVSDMVRTDLTADVASLAALRTLVADRFDVTVSRIASIQDQLQDKDLATQASALRAFLINPERPIYGLSITEED